MFYEHASDTPRLVNEKGVAIRGSKHATRTAIVEYTAFPTELIAIVFAYAGGGCTCSFDTLTEVDRARTAGPYPLSPCRVDCECLASQTPCSTDCGCVDLCWNVGCYCAVNGSSSDCGRTQSCSCNRRGRICDWRCRCDRQFITSAEPNAPFPHWKECANPIKYFGPSPRHYGVRAPAFSLSSRPAVASASDVIEGVPAVCESRNRMRLWVFPIDQALVQAISEARERRERDTLLTANK